MAGSTKLQLPSRTPATGKILNCTPSNNWARKASTKIGIEITAVVDKDEIVHESPLPDPGQDPRQDPQGQLENEGVDSEPEGYRDALVMISVTSRPRKSVPKSPCTIPLVTASIA